MKTRMIIGLVLIFAMASSTVLFQNCSTNEFAFSSIENDTRATRFEVDMGGGLMQVTDRFVVRVEKQTLIDMVWVIDNSGSMSAEAAHVRNNVLAFGTAVEAEARLKMALISSIGTTGYGTYLPETLKAKGGLEINQVIGSTNALMYLGAALCEKISPLFPCADLVDGGLSATSYTGTYGKLQGALDGFYRAGAKKLFVIVTDDESQVTGPDFSQFLMNRFPNERARIFGFIGQGAAASPCQAAEGKQYAWLANETAGAVYNVCASDWTSHFSELTQAVSGIANYEYELKMAQILNVISVKINGVALDSSAYTIRNGVLTLSAMAATTMAGGTLEVIYTYQQI